MHRAIVLKALRGGQVRLTWSLPAEAALAGDTQWEMGEAFARYLPSHCTLPSALLSPLPSPSLDLNH